MKVTMTMCTCELSSVTVVLLPDVDRLVGVLEACRAVFRDIQTTQSKASVVLASRCDSTPSHLPHPFLQGYIIQKVQSQPTLNGTVEVTR